MYSKLSGLFNFLRKLVVVIFILFLGYFYLKGTFGSIRGYWYIIFALMLCLFKYLESLFNFFDNHNNEEMKGNLKYCFIVYLILLFFTLFIDRSNIFNFNRWFNTINLSNFIPFYNTIDMIKNIIEFGNYEALSLIVGNIIMLIPLAIFIPRLCKKHKEFKYFCVYVIVIDLLIEVIQMITGTGYFDIDDIILNTSGVILFYFIFNKTFLRKIIDKILLLSDDTIMKKDIIGFVLVVLVIVLLFFCSIKLFYSDSVGSYIEIVCDNPDCVGEDVLLYEDDNYLYYVKDGCFDSLYIDFKKDKYKLKDYLDGKGRKVYYNLYNIEVIQFRSNNYISKVSKYFESFIRYNNREIVFDFDYDKDILEIDIFNTEIDLSSYTVFYRVLPKKSGIIEVKCFIKNFFDNDEILDVKVLKFDIDDDLNVKEIG